MSTFGSSSSQTGGGPVETNGFYLLEDYNYIPSYRFFFFLLAFWGGDIRKEQRGSLLNAGNS